VGTWSDSRVWSISSGRSGETRASVRTRVIVNTLEIFSKSTVWGRLFFAAPASCPWWTKPLEPAAWGKMIFYGSSMEDFIDAKKLLEQERAGIEVKDPDVLKEKALFFLNHQEELREGGRRARKAILHSQGASRGHARSLPV